MNLVKVLIGVKHFVIMAVYGKKIIKKKTVANYLDVLKEGYIILMQRVDCDDNIMWSTYHDSVDDIPSINCLFVVVDIKTLDDNRLHVLRVR